MLSTAWTVPTNEFRCKCTALSDRFMIDMTVSFCVESIKTRETSNFFFANNLIGSMMEVSQ